MRTRDEIRDERKRYYSDVQYEAYRRGMNPDRINPDTCDQHYYEGDRPEAVVDSLQQRDQRRRVQQEYEEQMEYEELRLYMRNCNDYLETLHNRH